MKPGNLLKCKVPNPALERKMRKRIKLYFALSFGREFFMRFCMRQFRKDTEK